MSIVFHSKHLLNISLVHDEYSSLPLSALLNSSHSVYSSSITLSRHYCTSIRLSLWCFIESNGYSSSHSNVFPQKVPIVWWKTLCCRISFFYQSTNRITLTFNRFFPFSITCASFWSFVSRIFLRSQWILFRFHLPSSILYDWEEMTIGEAKCMIISLLNRVISLF